MWSRQVVSKVLKPAASYEAASVAAAVLLFANSATTNVERHGEKDVVSSARKETYRETCHPAESTFPLLWDGFGAPKVSCEMAFARGKGRLLKRQATVQEMEESATKDSLESRYNVAWSEPLGEGAFGAVYTATDRRTGEMVAIKKMSKKCTDSKTFQKEMNALLRLRDAGGHPNICGLRENFDEGGVFYLVLDLIKGGEMFDQLCDYGAYSEYDAARLIREITSALAFMHGIGIVHGDMKPENVMLSSTSSADAVIQVVDFGCAQVSDPNDPKSTQPARGITNTPAYSPPEILKLQKRRKPVPVEPSFDMWALGVIIYIMLTGAHPFDPYGQSPNQEVIKTIISGKGAPLHDSALTAHLSPGAISVIEQLLHPDPQKRLSAIQLLDHPWVKGETASQTKITNSDTHLSTYRKFKTKIGGAVFKDMLSMARGTSRTRTKRRDLIEHVFKELDQDDDGYLSAPELAKLARGEAVQHGDTQLTLSDLHDILSEDMKNRYFPTGHMIYHEGEVGNAMYFLNSGTIELSTSDGFRTTLKEPGSIFGEGALLHPTGKRSGSIKCLTPVHAIEISREYFDKYLAADIEMHLDLRNTDSARRHQRVMKILDDQVTLEERTFRKGDVIFEKGAAADYVYVVDEGRVDMAVDKIVVSSIEEGSMFGEAALLFGIDRSAGAECVSSSCAVRAMKASDLHKLSDSRPQFRNNLREIALRREFQKAICAAAKKPFPRSTNELRSIFKAFVSKKTGSLDLPTLRKLLLSFNPNYKEGDVRDLLQTLDMRDCGGVEWDEFKRLFEMDDD